MSHIRFASCPRCHYAISTGWTEPGMAPAVFCGACDTRLALAHGDEAGEVQPALDLYAWQVVPTEVSSRKGRVRRTKRLPASVVVARVPRVLTVVENPDREPRLAWRPDFTSIPCPCGAVGRIREWEAALACCPRCAQGPLQIDDGP